jgi:fucose permease
MHLFTSGLVIVIFLMGYGLATIPKNLFRERNGKLKLK